MDPDLIAFALPVIMIVGVCFFFGLIFAILIGSMIFIFSRIASTNKDAGQKLADGKEIYFNEKEKSLLPWQPGSIADLSSQVEYAGRSALGKLHYRGTIQSLQQPKEAWLAFDLMLNTARGSLYLQCTRYQIHLDFGGVGYKTIQVFENNAHFGIIQENEEIQLLDTAGRKWGVYHQHKLPLGLQPSDLSMKAYYGMIELDGQQIAELNRNPLLIRRWRGEIDFQPLFKNLVSYPNQEQEIWLLAIAGWELQNRIIIRT